MESKFIEKLGQNFVDNMYKNIDSETLKKAFEGAKWILKKDLKDYQDNEMFVKLCYTRQSSLFGFEDYKDHTKDSIDYIKSQINYNRLMQNCHYYNVNGKIFDTCIITLYNSGFNVDPYWSDGAVGFVNRHVEVKKVIKRLDSKLITLF